MSPLHRLNIQSFVDASQVDYPHRAEDRSDVDATLAAEVMRDSFRPELVRTQVIE